AHHTEIGHLAPKAREHAPECVAIGVVHFAGLQLLSDRYQLVAGGEERDAQLAPHAHLADAKRSDQSDIGGAQHPARPEPRLSFLQVFARKPAVLSAFLPWGNGDRKSTR